MKMNSNVEVGTVISNDLSEKNFGILANDKMFNILSSKIYSDKIAAPIRELCCNAYDAHVAAKKKDVPFNVHIPTQEECYFSVEDFGVGMDAYDIEELYTTYGYSSKTNSNRFVGCLGLGSKSPFAYTDSFRITSRKSGKEYLYQCLIENGVPKLIKFDEKDTEKQSGVKIEFNVSKTNIWDFSYKAANILKYFKVRPVTNIALHILDYPEFKYDIEIRKENVYHTHCVMMGNVCYPYVIRDFSDNPKYKQFYNQFYETATIMKAEIGEVEIAASREALEMSEKTMDCIARKHTNFSNMILEEMKAKRAECKSTFEYLFEYGRFLKKNKFIDRSDFISEANPYKIAFDGETELVKLTNNNGQHSHNRQHYTGVKGSINFEHYVFTNNSVKFVHVPEGRLASSQGINCEVDDTRNLIVYLFSGDSLKSSLESLNIPVYTKEDFVVENTQSRTYERIKDLEGISEGIIFYSYSSEEDMGLKFSTPYSSFLNELNSAEKVFYVKTKFRKVDEDAFKVLREAGMRYNCLSAVCKLLKKEGDFLLIGATEERIKKISKDEKYIDLIDYILKRFPNDSDAYRKVVNYKKLSDIKYSIGLSMFLTFKEENLTDKMRELADFIKSNKDLKLTPEEEIFLNIYNLGDNNNISEYAAVFFDHLLQNYPMTKFIHVNGSHYYWKEQKNNLQLIQNYINEVDENRIAKSANI